MNFEYEKLSTEYYKYILGVHEYIKQEGQDGPGSLI